MFTTAAPDSNRINNNLVPKQHDYHVSLNKLKRINKQKYTDLIQAWICVQTSPLFQSWIMLISPMRLDQSSRSGLFWMQSIFSETKLKQTFDAFCLILCSGRKKKLVIAVTIQWLQWCYNGFWFIWKTEKCWKINFSNNLKKSAMLDSRKLNFGDRLSRNLIKKVPLNSLFWKF